jgi:hypothetical protein
VNSIPIPTHTAPSIVSHSPSTSRALFRVLEVIADKRLCETPLKVAFNVAVPTGLLVLPTASADEQNRAQAVTRV